jgi:hypothetical protein
MSAFAYMSHRCVMYAGRQMNKDAYESPLLLCDLATERDGDAYLYHMHTESMFVN